MLLQWIIVTMVQTVSTVQVCFKLDLLGRSAVCSILDHTWFHPTYTPGHISGIFPPACGPNLCSPAWATLATGPIVLKAGLGERDGEDSQPG